MNWQAFSWQSIASMQWVMNPVNQIAILCGILGIGMLGSMTLWISLKMDVRAIRKAFDAYRETTEAALQELRKAMETAAEAAKTAPETAPAPAISSPLSVQGLDLTTRTKALRMARRGEAVGSIAATLGVAQEEIELLLKLERLLEVPAA
ncbi:MAG TPA: hypothetical protein VHA14_00660 [Bryobacteraceae bacterium]|nr:hypothetical protein [Bryobacteraceae bacterium]